MNCINCQTETTNPKFCSKSCSASYNNKKHPKRKQTRECKVDGCVCIVRNYKSKYCQLHFDESKDDIKRLTIGEYRNRKSVKLQHRSSLHAHIRGLARSWHKELIKLPCHLCPYDKHVELAHIKSLASFDDSALLEVVNHRDNVVQLCPNCHWEFDNGLATLNGPVKGT